MAKVLRPIGHEDRLSIVDHLDELRSRLFVSLAVLVVAFGICFWQNGPLLNVLNRALPFVSTVGEHGTAAVRSESVKERDGFLRTAGAFNALAAAPNTPAQAQTLYRQAAEGLIAAARSLPTHASNKELPITIGVGESFTTTLTVAAYFALLFSLPLLIYQGYAFVIPALNPQERNVAKPLMAVAPILFILGVAFAYVVIMPPAVRFLQGYNSSKFDVLVQAKQYYTFEIFTMLGVGLAFQLPLGLLGLHRLGVVNGSTLTRHWRYAVVIIAVIAAALPGADPVTTGLEATPLLVLFLASIVMLKIADRRAAAREAAEAAQSDEPYGGGLDMT
jgi:sec-independent protein translocase protein TatC